MELTPGNLEALAVVMRKYGITSVRNGDLELKLGAAPDEAPREEEKRDVTKEANPLGDLKKVPQEYLRAFGVKSV